MAKAKVEKVVNPEVEVQAAPQPSTALVVPQAIREQFKKDAEALKTKIQAPGGDLIKLTKDKHFKLPDGTKHPGPLKVTILAFNSTNKFFDRPYKDGEVTPPACFAIGEEPTSLVPSKNSPVKQAESCNKCPNNEFGSKGNGKACGNHRMLLVRAGEGDDASDPQAPKFKLQVSPTGVRAFDAYVSSIRTQFEAPIYAVVTEIYFDPNSEYQSLRFGNPTPNENLELHFKEAQAAKEALAQEPDVSGYVAPPKKGKK